MVSQVTATPAALRLIARLAAAYGGLLFHQAGGYGDPGSTRCYLPPDRSPGPGDLYLGSLGEAPFYIARPQFEYWKHTQLIIDVPPQADQLPLQEALEGPTFHLRSRLYSDAEWSELEATGRV